MTRELIEALDMPVLFAAQLDPPLVVLNTPPARNPANTVWSVT